ncbi:unnamed protein product [Adineta ricciae]|uniref:Doublecortin domain-containing protein n=1 Tax=Adineta ricciae TaxID=249248 RepID=A0A814U4A0_ADIRI|nr:unnamed protein product [Adineta ricciae]
MATSVSVRTTSHSVHHSLTIDEQNQYYGTTNDDIICRDYLNEMTPPQKLQSKDALHRQNTDPYSVPPRASSATTKQIISPYLQKLPHSNYIQTVLPPPASAQQRRQQQRRRRSTSMARTRDEQLDSAYQPSNVDHLDLSTFFGHGNRSSGRPTSAPIRPNTSTTSKKRTKTSTQRSSSKSQSFLITIYRNGNHEKHCYCKATSLNAIFQYATEKLHMASAARRLFDANGQEIYRSEDVHSNQEYFVSSGENFKDPYRSIKVQTEYSLNSTWTMRGLQTDTTKPKSFTTTAAISKRLDKQIKTSINLMIFENGLGHDTNAYHILIDSLVRDNLEKFLDYSTQRLQMTGHGRKAFTYRGDPIRSLKLFLESDDCKMQTVNDGIIYGPVWVSKGEKFRPTGAYVFLESRYKECQSQLKIYRAEYREIKTVIKKRQRRTMNGNEQSDTGDELRVSTTEGTDGEDEKDNHKTAVKNKSLLSMTKKELKELKEASEAKIEDVKELMKFYQTKMEEIEDMKKDEENLGANFATEHIKEVKFEDKIVGLHPICLFVHENGSYHKSDPTIFLNLRSLPSKTIPQTPIEYLLTYLQTSVAVFGRQRPKRVFDINGTELKLLGHLKSKQHIFISYGEDYRPAFEPCLAIQLHSVEVYNREAGLTLLKIFRTDDDMMAENEKRSAKQVAAAWQVTDTIPENVKTINTKDLKDDEKQAVEGKPIDERVDQRVTFLTKDKKLIYPELKISQITASIGKQKSSGGKPSKKVFSDTDLQTWYYDKDGYIYNKQINTLVLTTIPEENVQMTWTASKLSKAQNRSQELNGFRVQLRSRATEPSEKQIWDFTADGYIVSRAYPNYALTSFATIIPGEDETFVAGGKRMNENDAFVSFVALCPKCSADSPFMHRQRWGIRQTSGFTIGDWKHSKVENPIWHKMALTWPVDANGSMIPDLQWPIEGCFIPGVPPIKSLKYSQAPETFVPIRLQVLKNGERDTSKAVFVVGPDISNLILEPKSSSDMYRRLRIPEPEKEQRAHRQIKRMADARQREMKLFLENCTTLCGLPFAARRLFDEHGTELFDLTSIRRDSLVYATCGEQWIDPELTKAEQQRRLLLAYLSYDVRMIYFYCALRYPTEYVVSTETALGENSRLVLSKCVLTVGQRKRIVQGESVQHVMESKEPVEAPATEAEPRTAHERTHKRLDHRNEDKFRWPWERIANKSLDLGGDNEDKTNRDSDDDDVINPGDLSPKPMSTLPKTALLSMQQFRWDPSGGYISSMDDSNLVFGVKEIESKVVDVILKRRNPDDIFQRWVLVPSNDGDANSSDIDFTKPFLIASKARPTMVLTVLLPSCTLNESSEVTISCIGCLVTLQPRRYEENGCANQKWAYDEKLGFLYPFNATITDREITAANRANICSYTVNYEALSQPGFNVSILNTNDQSEDVPVCLACAQAMRGKYRLVKIEPEKKFPCAIGKRTDLKFHGPFHCLNHKVDLTRDEAENTLFQRQEQLEQLRQEASVRNIAKELAAAKQVQIVHLLAYRNGDGHTRQGKILVGSSIIGLLDQATHRLDLTNAARRFYVGDGTVILSIEDLIDWVTEYYKKCYTKLSKQPQTQLLDKVELNTPLPLQNPEAQRRSSTDSQSEKTTFSAKMRDISPNKQHFQGLPKSSDLKRAIKQNSAKRGLDIDMNYLLKFPIEVWVSSGEGFVNPSDVDQRHNVRIVQREERTPVVHELEREKHALRLMKGRRISSQSTGELVSQQNPDIPVVKQGHWTQRSDTELDQEDNVEKIQTSLDAIISSQQPEHTRPASSAALDRLSQHSKLKRIAIYLNGDSTESAVQCFGSNLQEMMENAKQKLGLMQPVLALYDENGRIIERFDQLTRDQLVCVSTTRTYIASSERQREVDIKAEWARTRNKYGDQATDIRVNSTLASFPHAADPFGPPLLTSEDREQSRPMTKPPPAPYRRLAIEQPAPKTTTVTEITPSPSMMKDSLMLSDDDESNSEIERITNSGTDGIESSRPISPRIGTQPSKSPFSQLFTTERAPSVATRNPPSTNKSDSDEDEFIKMLRK